MLSSINAISTVGPNNIGTVAMLVMLSMKFIAKNLYFEHICKSADQ